MFREKLFTLWPKQSFEQPLRCQSIYVYIYMCLWVIICICICIVFLCTCSMKQSLDSPLSCWNMQCNSISAQNLVLIDWIISGIWVLVCIQNDIIRFNRAAFRIGLLNLPFHIIFCRYSFDVILHFDHTKFYKSISAICIGMYKVPSTGWSL